MTAVSFMVQPQPDACRALMPTPEPHPPGPPSRPMACHMPKGHDGPHALTRRPGPLDRRWEGDARPVTAPTDGTSEPDEGRWDVAEEVASRYFERGDDEWGQLRADVAEALAGNIAGAARVDDPAAAEHGAACQIGSPWFLRDVGWLADGDISAEDLHQWRIYLGGYDNSQPVPSEACAYALINEPDWKLASLRHAPNGLPVWVRAAGDACTCSEPSR